MPSRHSPPTPLLVGALAAVYIVWGSTYLAIRVMVETMPPLLGTAARFVGASLLLLAYMAVAGRLSSLRVTRRQAAGVTCVGVLLLLGGTGLVGIAEQDVPSGLTALIIAAVPLTVVLLRRLVGEHIPTRTLVSVLIGFLGIALLVTHGGPGVDAPLFMLLLVVAASTFWSIGSFLAGRLELPADPVASTVLQMLAGGAACVLVAMPRGEFGELDVDNFSTESVAALAYLIVFGSVLAFSAYTWLLRNTPVSTASTYAYVNPVVAVFLGWVLLDETITASMLGAAALVIASVAVTVRTEGTRVNPRLERSPGAS